MLFEENYMDTSGELLSEMRLLIEGAITLYEDENTVFVQIIREANEPDACSAINDIGSALYLMRQHIKRLQTEHHKETQRQCKSGM